MVIKSAKLNIAIFAHGTGKMKLFMAYHLTYLKTKYLALLALRNQVKLLF